MSATEKSGKVRNGKRNGMLIDSPLEEMSQIAELFSARKLDVFDGSGPARAAKDFIVACLRRGVRSNITSDAIPELIAVQRLLTSAKLQIRPGSTRSSVNPERAEQIQTYLRETLLAQLRGKSEAANTEDSRKRRPRKQPVKKYEFEPYSQLES